MSKTPYMGNIYTTQALVITRHCEYDYHTTIHVHTYWVHVTLILVCEKSLKFYCVRKKSGEQRQIILWS